MDTMTKAEFAAARQKLFGRAQDQLMAGHPPFRVRAISEEWMSANKVPAYKTAVANVAYIWRDSAPTDRFGPLPAAFAQRRFELRSAGLILPGSAPLWAAQDYAVWAEADAATFATGDPTAIAGWHMVLGIPDRVPAAAWRGLITSFVERELAAKGRVTAWAIHALAGEDGWIIAPHAHLIVTARGWRHDARHGRRGVGSIGSWGGQRGLELAWRRACMSAPTLLFS